MIAHHLANLAEAQAWAARLVELLECADILCPELAEIARSQG